VDTGDHSPSTPTLPLDGEREIREVISYGPVDKKPGIHVECPVFLTAFFLL